jgi:bifunctional non-homologous end joining protein LigD
LLRRPPSAAAPRNDDSVAGVRLTHPDRVLYPGQGTTKRDLALFYEAIAEWIVPHLADRPTTLVRCPEGLQKPCFYQKHTGTWAPESLRRVRIKEQKKTGEYLVADTLAGLVGLVQIGILEIHTWSSKTAHLEQPDRLVFDLDPDPAVPWARVIDAARLLRDRLAREKLASFVKTTGGKGLHVVVPIAPERSWDDCALFASRFSEAIVRDFPGEYVATMSKAKRKGKIFIDHLRNVRGATSVAAYSTRAKPGAPVSAPLRWDELDEKTGPAHFTIANLLPRLARLRADPWKDYWTSRQRLPSGQ